MELEKSEGAMPPERACVVLADMRPRPVLEMQPGWILGCVPSDR